MTDLRIIIEFIESKCVAIIKNIDQESIDVYKFLQTQFRSSDVSKNYLFQFVYRNFYRLDNAGLTKDFKIEYFKVMERYKNEDVPDYETVLTPFHDIRNLKDHDSLQFSFITKLLATIHDQLPIYDSAVAKVFGMKRPVVKEPERKLQLYKEQFKHIKGAYLIIMGQKLLPRTISEFNHRFPEHGLSDIKVLDFIFWSTGKLISSGSLNSEASLSEYTVTANQNHLQNLI